MFALGVRTQAELAHVLGITQASVCDSFSHRRIPARWLLHILERKGINPEWIRSAEGPLMSLVPQTEDAEHCPQSGAAVELPAALHDDGAGIRRFLRTVPTKYLEEEISLRNKKCNDFQMI